jgi:hypothetical protein
MGVKCLEILLKVVNQTVEIKEDKAAVADTLQKNEVGTEVRNCHKAVLSCFQKIDFITNVILF